MTYREYVRVLRERWVVVALVTLIALGAALGAWFLQPRRYTATLTMYVSSQVESAGSQLQGVQLSQEMAAAYVSLITGSRVTGQVVGDLGLAESPSALARRITATNVPGSMFLDVAVVDDSPQRAADVANAVGQVFSTVVEEIEAPTEPGAAAAVAVRAVQPAAAPTEASSTALPVTLALGLLAGLVIGVGGALARNHLDTRIRSLQQLRAAVDAPVLGITTFDPTAGRRPLAMQENTQSPHAEAYRQLRTNLLFTDGGRGHRVIVVTGATQGEGRTTTVANLALALAGAGRRVAVVEADLRRPLLADVLGVDRTVGLTDVLEGRAGLGEAMRAWSDRVHVLPSGPLPADPGELLASPRMAAVLHELRAQFDVVLVDTSPLLTLTDAAGVAPAADGVLVVCRYAATTRDQLMSAVQAVGAVSARLVGTVLTMVPTSGPFTEIVAPATSTAPAAPAAPRAVLPGRRAAAEEPHPAVPAGPAVGAVAQSPAAQPAHQPAHQPAPQPAHQPPPAVPPTAPVPQPAAAYQPPPAFQSSPPFQPVAPSPAPSRVPRQAPRARTPVVPEVGPERRNGSSRHSRS